MMHHSVHPIKISIVQKKHPHPRKHIIRPTVGFNVIVGVVVFTKGIEGKHRYCSKYGNRQHREEYVSTIVGKFGDFLLDFTN